MNAPQQTKFRVEGMDCASCATKIDTAVRRMPGVVDVSVSVTRATLTIDHDGSGDLAAITRRVAGLGYPVTPLVAEAGTATSSDHRACCGHDHQGHDHEGRHDYHHDNDHGREQEHADHHHHDHANAAPAIAGLHGHDHSPSTGPWWRSGKGRLTILAGAALAVAYLVSHLFPALSPFVFTLGMLVGLIPIARRAAMAALAGIPFSIEMLMTIAAVGAIAINATEEAGAVVFLFLVGELLEGVAAGRARDSINALSALVPKTALIEDDGATREVPAEALSVGAVILVRPGDRIAADGVILEGEGAIDESPVSGESVPVHKGINDTVFAGTVNGDSALRIRVTAAARDNTIARVVRLVEEAQEARAPTERFIDRFSRYYTPGVVVVAALVAVVPPLLLGAGWGEWIYKGLAVLLIGCPCALVISTPAAIAAALSAGARRGLLLKGGNVLETLGRLDVIAFDKTGTLTEGRPQVTEILSFGKPLPEILSFAAALEQGSSHPLGRAVLRRAEADGIAVPAASGSMALGGKGIAAQVGTSDVFFGSAGAASERAMLDAEQVAAIARLHAAGNSVSVLVVDGIVAGAIAMRDEPRTDAKAGLEALDRAGIRSLMLTGDNERTAQTVGAALGIAVKAGLMPQDKQRIVAELKAQGLRVGKVGDGINDAPALALADVGIAMGGGTDVALETADAAVLHGRVGDVARMVALSRRTMRNIYQNIGIALGLKAIFLVTTIAGITGLWPAILADTGATVLVTANALRLLRPVE